MIRPCRFPTETRVASAGPWKPRPVPPGPLRSKRDPVGAQSPPVSLPWPRSWERTSGQPGGRGPGGSFRGLAAQPQARACPSSWPDGDGRRDRRCRVARSFQPPGMRSRPWRVQAGPGLLARSCTGIASSRVALPPSSLRPLRLSCYLCLWPGLEHLPGPAQASWQSGIHMGSLPWLGGGARWYQRRQTHNRGGVPQGLGEQSDRPRCGGLGGLLL